MGSKNPNATAREIYENKRQEEGTYLSIAYSAFLAPLHLSEPLGAAKEIMRRINQPCRETKRRLHLGLGVLAGHVGRMACLGRDG
jgi:hypothetical protein